MELEQRFADDEVTFQNMVGAVLPLDSGSVYVLITPSSTDREFNNEIGSALYLARTNYGTDIHLCSLG
jgi:hypothetical protein